MAVLLLCPTSRRLLHCAQLCSALSTCWPSNTPEAYPSEAAALHPVACGKRTAHVHADSSSSTSVKPYCSFTYFQFTLLQCISLMWTAALRFCKDAATVGCYSRL
jgi:hypothetical protein